MSVNQEGEVASGHFLLPYAFYNESFGAALGVAYGASGQPQKQMSYVASLMAGTEGSVAAYFLGKDIQVPLGNRLFVDPWISAGYFGDQDVYRNGNPDYPGGQAGSNSSSENDYVTGSGTDLYAYLRFKFILPLGSAEDEAILTQVVDRGILVSGATGGDIWNPLKTGVSRVELQPFIREQDVDSSDLSETDLRTAGLTLALAYDNRDFEINPSRGSFQRVSLSRDFGVPETSTSWTVIDAEYSKYISLPTPDCLRQQVLAFGFWTAEALTWEEHDSPNGPTFSGTPPNFMGARLGGLWRMRAYPTGRFSDKAAIYYTAEYRVIPEWNPLNKIPYVKKLDSNWMQWVLFFETGRVAPHWNVSELHSSMKWDAGVGVRILVKGLVARVGIAYSPETIGVQMMVGQPF